MFNFNKKHLTILMVFILLFSTMLAGCSNSNDNGNAGSSSDSGKTVKIAFLNPLSGSNADAGEQDLNAAKLAVKHINENGGIKSLDGAQVELVISDTTSDASQAQSVAERTFTDHKVAGAVGTGISALTLPILPVAEKHQVPILTNSISDDITKQGYQYVFQVTPKGSQFGQTQVDFLKFINEKYDLGLTKVAVVYENSSYGVSTAKGVKEIATNAGLDVVLDQSYPQGFTDASPLVTAVKRSGAEVIFPVAYTTDAKLIINTMKSMNYDPLIIGGGAGFLWPAMEKELGDNINGLVSVASWNWDSANISGLGNAEIPEDYEKEYGTFMTEHAGPTYTAVRLIAEAVDQAGSDDPVKVRETLAQLDIDSGPCSMMQPGELEFDDTGWNKYVHPVMIQWQDNKPRTVYPAEDSINDFIPPEINK